MANKSLIIKTPRGTIVNSANKSGKIHAELTWNESFGAEKTQDLTSAQKFVDSEVLRMCGPYVPLQTGMLQKSGTLGTVIGSGEVEWVAPYAQMQYWETSESRTYDANSGGKRGGKWFERMKADHKDQIIKGAKNIGGGK